MYSETSKPKTKESQKCHGRVRNLKILSKVLQTRLDKCVKKKASRKVQKHSDCYICFQYLQIGLRYFSRNLSGKCCNIFYFLQNFVRPADLRGGPRGLGGLAHRRGSVYIYEGSKAKRNNFTRKFENRVVQWQRTKEITKRHSN